MGSNRLFVLKEKKINMIYDCFNPPERKINSFVPT